MHHWFCPIRLIHLNRRKSLSSLETELERLEGLLSGEVKTLSK